MYAQCIFREIRNEKFANPVHDQKRLVRGATCGAVVREGRRHPRGPGKEGAGRRGAGDSSIRAPPWARASCRILSTWMWGPEPGGTGSWRNLGGEVWPISSMVDTIS